MKTYSLDSNALIEPWNKYYAPEIAPGYWTQLDALAQEGRVFCTWEVRRELEHQKDELWTWVKERPHLFREETRDVLLVLRDVLKLCPRAIGQGKGKHSADPLVIAHAIVEKAVVVTKEESRSGKFKIPDVCQAMNVPWMPDYAFAREIGVKAL